MIGRFGDDRRRRAAGMPVGALALVALVAAGAAANTADPAEAERAAPASPDRGRRVTVEPGDDWNALCLRLAVTFWRTGDVAGAVDALRLRDADGIPSERADFLIAAGLRRLGDRPGFAATAGRLRADSEPGSWIAAVSLLDAAVRRVPSAEVPAPPADHPGLRLVAADLLLRQGRSGEALAMLEGDPRGPDAVRDALTVRARESRGEDPAGTLRRLAAREMRRAPETDLVAAARIRLAADAFASGRTGADALSDVPAGSAYSSRGRHLLGRSKLDAGATREGRTILRELFETEPSYEARRDLGRTLGFLALDERRFSDAHRTLAQVEAAWRGEDEELARLAASLDDATAERLWNAWALDGRSALVLDRTATDEAFEDFAGRALDLRHDSESPDPPAPAFRLREAGAPSSLVPPDPERVRELHELSERLAAARFERRESARRLEARETARRREERYFDLGIRRSDDGLRTLDAIIGWTDSVRVRTDELLEELRVVRDTALVRIVSRTGEFLDRAERQAIVARSLHHYYVEGPNREPESRFPEGVPPPRVLLREETELAEESLTRWFESFATLAAILVNRSHDEVWQPRVTSGVQRLADAAAELAERAGRVRVAIDSTRTDALDPSRLAGLRSEAARDESRVRELAALERETRHALVRDAIADARRRLAREGEGIAYGLAVASHERAIGETVAGASANPRLLDESTDRYRDFLDRYPESPARSEIRFRLADALMTVARDDFNVQMVRFLGSEAPAADHEAKAFAPFVDYGPALELYLAILDSDPGYAHRDAVLFHAGMILSDEGDPAGSGHLAELVERYPRSPHAQEAHLRLGDDRFLGKDFAGCIPHFEAAAAGEDPELAAIALYKSGWAHYNRDRFPEGADAFRRLLDLYATDENAARTTDLRREAEEYLVHCLARAGGVPAFRDLFDEVGARPYEAKTLAGLGHLLRRFSLFEEAAATDRVWLERWPTHPGALEATQRLVQTLERAGRADAARAARLEHAPRFFPGSDWYEANPSPSLRAEAAEYARSATKTVALHHHHAARETNDPAEWRRALDLYGTMVARWPDSAETPTFHYYAGEAAAALSDWPLALSHFETAAASDTASFRGDAAWQSVAVRDTWYESSRAAADSGATGADSLATALIASIDAFTRGHAGDPRAADLLWRKGHLALAHGRSGVAAEGFGGLMRDFPDDERAPVAAQLQAQAQYESGDFVAAGQSYAQAAQLATAAGRDSLAAVLAPLVPHCSFRQAETLVAKGDGAAAARGFEELADRWPEFSHADQALYRAGLAWSERGREADALRAWGALVSRHPDSEYRRDAQLRMAGAWEKEGRPEAAARALAAFSESFPDDADAGPALLRAADFFAAAGDDAGAEDLRTSYLDRFPEDTETAMEVLAERAGKELAGIGPGRPISGLLAVPTPATKGSSLRRYLDLAAAHPDLASRAIVAEVHFRQGEEARSAYERARLTQPLEKSVALKKTRLEEVLNEYRSAASFEAAPWNRAAACRIGECLVAFGDALLESERPGGLGGDDLAAYEEVLEEQSWQFFDKGEEAWTALLRRAADASVDDEWVSRARAALWPRLAMRFVHRPEVEYPLVAANGPTAGGER